MPAELKSPKKGLTNIKNKDQKCFSWCHFRLINPVKTHPERITWEDKKHVNYLDYDRVEFPLPEKGLSKIGKKNNICIKVFCYENKLTFPIYILDQKFENWMDLLLVTNGDKSHYVYVKDFDRYMFHKTNNKNKKYFCKICFSVLVVKMH